ncbi:MAG: 4Fe-4S dicluster domain-containing protein [Anaerolineae bacterium]|nr:4Fe-4S dicluster domain-containing protein [Anaerolineae bacterium]
MQKSENEISPDPKKGSVSRRDLLKIAGGLAVTAGLTQFISLNSLASTIKEAEVNPDGVKWGMLIDINKCIGCNYCTYACQAINNLSDDMLYNVVTTETTQNGTEFFLSRPCMQCAEAPCVHVCPVEATYYREDGIVSMDYDRCIGCRYCQVACPYDARVFNWHDPIEKSELSPTFGLQEVPNRQRGVVEKCHFCSHRIDDGLERGLTPGVDPQATPACVVACPTGARVFGDLNHPESPISKARDEARVTLRLREELSTEPRVYYIPPDSAYKSPFKGE